MFETRSGFKKMKEYNLEENKGKKSGELKPEKGIFQLITARWLFVLPSAKRKS